MRLNVTATLATLIVALSLVAIDDNTSWSRGYGYDGRLYGDLAQHFPGAAFGDDGVIPPGIGKYTEKPPEGIDAYYVRRILPSAVVYYSLSALSLDKTHGNVIACFEVWNALMIALVALLWCLCADRVGLGRSAKLLGLCALMINFAVLKAAFYYPVGTDTFALGFAALSMYFWLSRNTIGLAVVTFLNAFIWPTAVPLGLVLILFPPGVVKLSSSPLSFAAGRARPTILKVAAAANPSLALLAYLIHLRATHYRAPEEVPLGGAFPFAALTAAAFVFGALLFLIPDLGRRQVRDVARSLLSLRVLVAVAVVGSAILVQSAIAQRPGYYDELDLLRSSIWYSALNPVLFAVAMVGFFGPLLALAIVEWPRICRRLQSLGPGAILVAALFIASAPLTESRKSLAFYPFIVLFVVLACEEITAHRWSVPVFALISVAASRIWLPIGEFGVTTSPALRDFPAQRYFMSSGIWTSFEMYLVQLAGICLLIVLYLAFRGRPTRGAALGATASIGGARP